MEENTQQKTVYVIQKNERRRSNGLGTAGFVTALIGLLICWIPVVGWAIGGILTFLGFIFSFIGLFKSPRGLAIAGFIMSIISACVIVGMIGVISIGLID